MVRIQVIWLKAPFLNDPISNRPPLAPVNRAIAMSQWIETYRGAVKAWECDTTEHFTVAYYFDRFADAVLTLLEAHGMGLPYMRAEAELLQVDSYFDGGIYGALDDYKNFSKKMLIERILRESDFRGEEFLGFGDGYVEIENVKDVGGRAVGAATDEPACAQVDPVKRKRLAGAGADWIVPNYNRLDELLGVLFPA